MSEAERGIRTTVAVIDSSTSGIAQSPLHDALQQAGEVSVVACTSQRDDVIDLMWQSVPDAIVVGVDEPGFDAIALCQELSDALPVCRVLLVSEDGDAPFAAMVAGAAAVVSRATLTAVPGVIVQQVARGEAILSQGWAGEALHAFELDGAPHLTATEREVLQRLAKGTSSEVIAGLHEVPARLVRLHAAYALAKLQRAERDRRLGTEPT